MLKLTFIKPLMKPLQTVMAFAEEAAAATAGAGAALWTFPSVLGSAMLIAWAAEAAQFLVSQGLALAILAWLQTLPEFAVEAVIAWQAGETIRTSTNAFQIQHATSLMTANFTGSLRLLVGLGWPMIYVTAATFHRRQSRAPLREIKLDPEHAVEVVFLFICIAYFCVVWWKGSLTVFDTALLTVIYGVYLFFLNKIPPQGEEKIENLDRIPRFILRRRRALRNSIIVGLFVGGGMILYFTAHPFLDSLKAIAVGLGLSTFVFVQWVAPFLSEFPEKVSAFNWARRVTMAPLALMNMVSSNINQWTMLVAMLPIAYALALGRLGVITFDEHQRLEILLTIGQSLLGAVLLANMRFSWWEALLLFVLWLAQFGLSGFEKPPIEMDGVGAHNSLATHLAAWLSVGVEQVEMVAHRGKLLITATYFAWAGFTVALAFKRRNVFAAFAIFPRLMREHW
jgi:cation:H+ antiporter